MRYYPPLGLLVVLIVMCFATGIANAQEATEEATEEVLVTFTPVPSATSTATASATVITTAATTETVYVVQRGDNLFRIALRFNTTVAVLAQLNGIVNPSLIYVGQQIRVPGTAIITPTPPPVPTTAGTAAPSLTPSTVPAGAPTSTPTAVPATTTYVVRPGDTLARIAITNNTTVANLVALNNLANPNLIFVGQTLIIPAPGMGQPIAPVAPISTEEVVAPTLPVVITQSYGFAYGIEAYLAGQEATLVPEIVTLGMQWVKQEVNWSELEPTKGQIDFTALDTIVDTLEAQNLNILLTIDDAPVWSRASTEENGPPDNFADFGTFAGALAQHYAGRVQAYEIWSEPNLRREWNSTVHTISASTYLDLLRQGYNAIKAADPDAVVISAGLSPTGFNDGVNAINDRLFLTALYTGGLASISDAVGAHPSGWANPPDARCCAASTGVTTHFEDRSFYFLDTLTDYRQIMVQNNDGNTAIWVTKFGWGTSEDTDPPSQNQIFVSYTSLAEQATYIPRGFELGAELGFVGPMFLSNLNGCDASLALALEACYYSLIGPNGAPRPAFDAVAAIDKSAPIINSTSTPTLVPTSTPIFAPTFTPGSVVEITEEAAPTSDGGLIAPVVETPTEQAIPTKEPATTQEAAP